MTGTPPWMFDAACRHMGPTIFIIERGESCGPAKTVCARCPVIAPCLEMALASTDIYGVWGGTSDRERRSIRRRRNAQRRRNAGRPPSGDPGEAVRLYGAGWPTDAIARHLDVDIRTVQRYIEQQVSA